MNTMKPSTKAVNLSIFIIAVLVLLLAPCMTAAGQLQPTAPPGPTMKTLDQIPGSWSQKIPAAADRFVLVLDGAGVLDRETGLVWERNLPTYYDTWVNAFVVAYATTISGRKGWRLPTVAELESLKDLTVSGAIKLPAGHPFQNVHDCCYWTSTELTCDPGNPYVGYMGVVHMNSQNTAFRPKSDTYYIWPVRGPQ